MMYSNVDDSENIASACKSWDHATSRVPGTFSDLVSPTNDTKIRQQMLA